MNHRLQNHNQKKKKNSLHCRVPEPVSLMVVNVQAYVRTYVRSCVRVHVRMFVRTCIRMYVALRLFWFKVTHTVSMYGGLLLPPHRPLLESSTSMDHEMTDREMVEISVVQWAVNCLSTQLAQMDTGHPVMPPCCRCGIPTGGACETCIGEELYLPSWRGYAVALSLLFRCTPLWSVCDEKFMCCQFHGPPLRKHIIGIRKVFDDLMSIYAES